MSYVIQYVDLKAMGGRCGSNASDWRSATRSTPSQAMSLAEELEESGNNEVMRIKDDKGNLMVDSAIGEITPAGKKAGFKWDE